MPLLPFNDFKYKLIHQTKLQYYLLYPEHQGAAKLSEIA